VGEWDIAGWMKKSKVDRTQRICKAVTLYLALACLRDPSLCFFFVFSFFFFFIPRVP
jgi:hypothetical protein